MSKNPESPLDRLKKVALWQWGLIVICAGVAGGAFASLSASPGRSAADRGAALGRGVATLVFILAGVALIIMHFVRRRRG